MPTLSPRGPAAHPGHNALGPPQLQRLRLPLGLVPPGVRVGDARLGQPTGDVVDQDLAGLGGGLHPRPGIHPVAHHDAFAGLHDGRDLAGHDPGAGEQARYTGFGAVRRDGADKLQRSPDGPLRVVLAGGLGAPDREHGVADELLHGAAVALDQRAGQLEVTGEQLPQVLGLAGLGQRRPAHQVDEDDGDPAQFAASRSRRLSRCDPSAGVQAQLPHWPQNRCEGAAGTAPHAWQPTVSAAPQPPQNWWSTGLAAPHFVHDCCSTEPHLRPEAR